MRSCQLVYLLLLLCSVQVVETRVAGLLVLGAVDAVAASRLVDGLEGRSAQRETQAAMPGREAEPAIRGHLRVPAGWPRAAGHASAVAAFTSFARA